MIKKIIISLLLIIIIFIGVIFFIYEQDKKYDKPLSSIINVGTNPVFSLDAEVINGDVEIDKDVYFVEYRSSPNYRISKYKSGNISEIYNIPKGSLVYSISKYLDNSLVVAYSDSLSIDTNSLYILDLDNTQEGLKPFNNLIDGVLYKDISIDKSGNIWATKIDSNQEIYSIVRINKYGEIDFTIANAINPVVGGGYVYYFPLEKDNSRRVIGRLDLESKLVDSFDVFQKEYDLDGIIVLEGEVYVSVLNYSPSNSFSIFGIKAIAHGNHNLPSRWVKLGDFLLSYEGDLDMKPKIIYDSFNIDEKSYVEITNEGLELVENQERVLIIKSRALRYVAII